MAGLIFLCLFGTLVHSSCEMQRQIYFRNDYFYIESVKKFYKIHDEPKTWVDAKERCEWEGTSLYYPTSKAEDDAFLAHSEKARGMDRYWFGISSILSDGVFMTIDGQPLTEGYKNWNHGEPNDLGGGEECVEKRGGGMNDVQCQDKSPFICKKTLASLEWNTACQMPYTDYKYNETLSKCYKLHLSPKTWTAANAMCTAELSYLAIIDSQDEADFFADVLDCSVPDGYRHTPQGAAHLGFHNKFGHGWKTVKGVALENTDYMLWGGQPASMDSERCGAMSFDGQIKDVACDQRSLFICEHDLVRNPTQPAV